MIDPPLPRFYPHYPVEKQVKISGISRVSLSDSISSIILDCYDRKLELVRGEEPDGKFKTSVHKQWPRHARVHARPTALMHGCHLVGSRIRNGLVDWATIPPSFHRYLIQNLIRSISRSILLLFLNFNTFVVILFNCKETVVYIIVFNEVKLF